MSNARNIADAGHTLKAWVNFNGTITGTQVGSDYHFTTANNGIRAAYNVDYVIDRGAGTYDVHFENAMQDTNYVVTSTGRHDNGVTEEGFAVCVQGASPFNTSTIRISTHKTSTSLFDSVFVMIAIFGS